MKKILLSAAAMFILGAISLQAQNLLQNAGFETWSGGRPSNWTVTTSTLLVQNKATVNEGTSACQVNAINSSANFNINQAVQVTPGKTYRLKLSYYVVSGDGTDAKILSYFRNANNVSIKMSLEDSLALKGPGGNNAFFASNVGKWNTYTCDIVAPTGAATFMFYVRTSGFCSVIWDDFYFAENTAPSITTSKSSLTGFNYVPGAGPSTEQSFTIKGVNISGNITVQAPQNYEISGMSGASFTGTSSLTIAPSGTQVGPLSIYVRLKSGLAAGTYSGNLTVSSLGATTATIPLSGDVAYPAPIINTSSTNLSGFSYTENAGPSTQQSFTVSGSNLTGSIVINAPTNFEISALGGNSFTGTNRLSLSQSGGTVPTATLYVRLKSGLSVGAYNGTISLSSSGTTKLIDLSGTVNQVPGIVCSTDSVKGLNYITGAGPSAQKSFTISGTGLSSFVVVAAPTDFEISTDGGTSFIGTSQLIIPETNGVLPTTTVYIRLIEGLSVKQYSGNISISSNGNTSKTIALTGEVSLSTASVGKEASAVKFSKKGNSLVVDCLNRGDVVTLYSSAGICLSKRISDGGSLSFDLKTNGIYFIRTGNTNSKIVF